MTYLVDTNVVSELRKQRPDARVLAWVEHAVGEGTYLSVLVLGELRQGVDRLRARDPAQASALGGWLVALEEGFSDRILDVDRVVAHAWGRIGAGDPLPRVDGLIAATALVHGLTVATRDGGPFERVGVPWLDPWSYGEP